MSSLISLKDICKNYGSFQALKGVTLEIGPGITGLLGPNGAGKSTLIKVLLGLVRVTSGDGKVLGHDIQTESAAIRSRIGFMPEDDCYMYGQSGIESVQVAGRLSRLPATEALRRGHEILDFCGMGQERYRNVETYSTGMRQKLRFAMAIVHDPELIILDEPTSGLDPEEREAMLNRISILARKFGKAVILCTHILPDVKVVCDHVTILAGGKIQESKSLDELLEVPNPMVFVDVASGFDELQVQLDKQGLSATLGERDQLVVPGSMEAVGSEIWSAAEKCKASIRNLSPAKSSLEKVFVKIVQGSHHADS